MDEPEPLGLQKIPIAVLFAGDLICLDYSDMPENPSVCIWYHEESEEFQPVVEKVADSFGAFTRMLFESDEEDDI